MNDTPERESNDVWAPPGSAAGVSHKPGGSQEPPEVADEERSETEVKEPGSRAPGSRAAQ